MDRLGDGEIETLAELDKLVDPLCDSDRDAEAELLTDARGVSDADVDAVGVVDAEDDIDTVAVIDSDDEIDIDGVFDSDGEMDLDGVVETLGVLDSLELELKDGLGVFVSLGVDDWLELIEIVPLLEIEPVTEMLGALVPVALTLMEGVEVDDPLIDIEFVGLNEEELLADSDLDKLVELLELAELALLFVGVLVTVLVLDALLAGVLV